MQRSQVVVTSWATASTPPYSILPFFWFPSLVPSFSWPGRGPRPLETHQPKLSCHRKRVHSLSVTLGCQRWDRNQVLELPSPPHPPRMLCSSQQDATQSPRVLSALDLHLTGRRAVRGRHRSPRGLPGQLGGWGTSRGRDKIHLPLQVQGFQENPPHTCACTPKGQVTADACTGNMSWADAWPGTRLPQALRTKPWHPTVTHTTAAGPRGHPSSTAGAPESPPHRRKGCYAGQESPPWTQMPAEKHVFGLASQLSPLDTPQGTAPRGCDPGEGPQEGACSGPWGRFLPHACGEPALQYKLFCFRNICPASFCLRLSTWDTNVRA